MNEKAVHAVYHSGHLRVLAQKAYERSLVDGADAMSSIVLSALTLECFINELTERLHHPYLSDSDRLTTLQGTLNILEERRAPLLSRIDAIHLILVGHRIDKGDAAFQDLHFVNALRNALVHRRSERFEWDVDDMTKEYEPHKFVAYLTQRGVIRRPGAGSPPVWTDFVLVPDVARWVHNTVVAFISDIVGWLPSGLLKKATKVITNDWKQIAI